MSLPAFSLYDSCQTAPRSGPTSSDHPNLSCRSQASGRGRPEGRRVLVHRLALGCLFLSLEVTNLRVERIRGVYQRPVTGTGGILDAACGREHTVRLNLPTHAFPARAAAPVDITHEIQNLVDSGSPTFDRRSEEHT